jgi:pimeloyl-ACP methyl ester carboxylesterase
MSNSLFADQYKGALKAPAYIIWGEKDQACSRPICLDGLGDYLAKDSEITILPRSGHWTPVEQESRAVLASVIAVVAGRNAKPVTKLTAEIQNIYPEATMMAKK